MNLAAQANSPLGAGWRAAMSTDEKAFLVGNSSHAGRATSPTPANKACSVAQRRSKALFGGRRVTRRSAVPSVISGARAEPLRAVRGCAVGAGSRFLAWSVRGAVGGRTERGRMPEEASDRAGCGVAVGSAWGGSRSSRSRAERSREKKMGRPSASCSGPPRSRWCCPATAGF